MICPRDYQKIGSASHDRLFSTEDHLPVFQHDTKMGFNFEEKNIITLFFQNKVKKKKCCNSSHWKEDLMLK